jgi:predicted SAM-dependent methyltransferase
MHHPPTQRAASEATPKPLPDSSPTNGRDNPLRRVHLGCFDRSAPGWYNTDITPHQFVARIPLLATALHRLGWMTEERHEQHRRGVFRDVHYLNVRRRFPFRDDSVEAYFSSHMLEHLPIFDAKRALQEIYRTLLPSGFVRFVLPDLEIAVERYDREDPVGFLEMVFSNHAPTGEKNRHHWMYTAPYLERMLREVGFQFVWLQAYRKSHYRPFIDLDNRPENSFYMEAQK